MYLKVKFMDGSPVPQDYERAVQQMISDACDAEEMFGLDELEDHFELEQIESSPAAKGQ
jgi:hypothetical protein